MNSYQENSHLWSEIDQKEKVIKTLKKEQNELTAQFEAEKQSMNEQYQILKDKCISLEFKESLCEKYKARIEEYEKQKDQSNELTDRIYELEEELIRLETDN